MATTETFAMGDGTTTEFGFPFPYIKTEDVKVELQEYDATQTAGNQIISRQTVTAFIVPSNNPTVVQFSSIGTATNYQAASGAPLANHAVSGLAIRVRIYRFTDADSIPATFIQGSAIRAQDLNDNFEQNLYIMQERQNTIVSIQTGGIGENVISTNALQDDSVDASKLRDSVSDDTQRAVTTNHIRDNAITSAKIADVDSNLVTFDQSVTGSVSRTVESRLKDVISVKDFGAVGDGVTDDTAAIQAAIDYCKSLKTQTYYSDAVTPSTASYHFAFTFKLIFPPGVYRITSSLNLTNIQYAHSWWCVEARGAVFMLECAGKAAFDFLKSRKCWWNGGTFISNGTSTSTKSSLVRTAIQLGRDITGNPADSHRFSSIEVRGYYSWACIYNYASEDVLFDNIALKNDYDDVDTYCIIQDGSNQWGVTSDHIDVAAQHTTASFLRNTFIRFDARKTKQGAAVWINSTAWHHQFKASYLVAEENSAVVLYTSRRADTTLNRSFKNLEFDVHIETDDADTDPNTGLDFAFYIDAPESTDVFLEGFKYLDNSTHAQVSIFKRSPNITAVQFRDLDLAVDVNRDVGQTLFDAPDQYTITGHIQNYSTTLSLDTCIFSGDYYCFDPTLLQTTRGQSSYRAVTDTGTYYYNNNKHVPLSNGTVFKHSYYNPSDIVTPSVELSVNTSTGTIVDIVSGVNAFVKSSAAFYPGDATRDNTINLGISTVRWANGFINTLTTGTGTTQWTSGAGSPEGVLTAVVGSLYTRTDGGAGTTLYIKESGTGSTGWVAK